MSRPKTIAIRIPTEAYEKLQKMAEHDRRSMTQQAGTIIEAAWLQRELDARTPTPKSGMVGG